jgi:hypothetical protein
MKYFKISIIIIWLQSKIIENKFFFNFFFFQELIILKINFNNKKKNFFFFSSRYCSGGELFERIKQMQHFTEQEAANLIK